MNTNLLAVASGLSDQDLLARLVALAGKEREASLELVAHLAELDTRSSLYAAHGYGSLFTYCTEVLSLSEDAACNRIAAARACRRFPVILDALASGVLSLTSIRMLNPHLTPENHEAVLARASGRSRREIEAWLRNWRRDRMCRPRCGSFPAPRHRHRRPSPRRRTQSKRSR
jgi:hypothetical protein